MKFYLQRRNGTRKILTMDEVEEHLSKFQIEDAIAAKQADPNEEVSYMTIDGFVTVEM